MMCVMNYYTCPFRVGSHHYALGFRRLGYDVAYVSKPLSPWHLLFAKNKERTDRYEIWRNQGLETDGIWSYVPMASFTPSHAPLLRSRLAMNHWHRFMCPDLVRLLGEKGFGRVKILWFDNPVFAFLMDKIPHERSVLRVADNLKGFPTSWKYLIEKETELLRRVDRVVYTATNLKQELVGRADESKMTFVPNGVDFEFFAGADKTFPEEYRDIPSPRIVYVGAIDTWFDFAMLARAARELPACHFVLIGLARTDVSALRDCKNVHLLGPKPYARMPQFLAHAQVGMIPFVRNELVEFVNPLKLYEYMACGLPVVSTSWQELRAINSPALLAATAEEFVSHLRRVLAERPDPATLVEYARQNDWQTRLRSILGVLGE